MQYEPTKHKKYNTINITQESNSMSIKVNTKMSDAKAIYKETKAQHRAAVKSLRRDIKSHKLLINQAKTVYKLAKLSK